MPRFEVLQQSRSTEAIDPDRTVEVWREEVRLPETPAVPSLAVERSTPLDAHRGPPVILVHGFAQNRATWRVRARSFSGFLAARGFEVLNLDLRGHGASGPPGPHRAAGVQGYVEDIAHVARTLCERPPFLIGHSLGAGACLGAAGVTSAAGLVHIAGVYVFATRNRAVRGLARIGRRAETVLGGSSARVSTAWLGQTFARLGPLADLAGHGFPIAGWVPGSMERDVLTERLARGFDWTSLPVVFEMCRWGTGEPFPYLDALHGRDTPLLVVAGNRDVLLHPAEARLCYEGAGCVDREMWVFGTKPEHGGDWGHLDLILGRRAPDVVWPRLADWLWARSDRAPSAKAC